MLLTEVAFLVAEHELQVHWLSGCGAWNLPGQGVEPTSPALEGGFLSTAQPGKSFDLFILFYVFDLYSLLGLVHPSSWISHFHVFSLKLIFIAL